MIMIIMILMMMIIMILMMMIISGEAEEEWVTKKKVDIVTTKSVERKVQRQIVLEDGRVVEEEVPVVTVDTTEDTQTFQTDQDEAGNNTSP